MSGGIKEDDRIDVAVASIQKNKREPL